MADHQQTRRFCRPVLIACLALIGLSACQTRPVTIVPATQGEVIRVSDDTHVSGARILVIGAEVEAISGDDGAFTLPAQTTTTTSVPLPVSGVFRKTAVLKAVTDDARGYGPADFISISDTALHPVNLFLLPPTAPYDTGDIPADCELPDEAIYALQLLDRSDWLRTALADTPEYRFSLTSWLDRTLVRELPDTCEIPLAQLTGWNAEINALDAAAD
ncbi:hypothetical protein [Henriciella litoralis]|uniref:hypothetical protein n=1 Tax=Henriciella litoralis TaxID=568102 RepID=UPI000A0754EC|nr:hypothetical protein [Henriciella litoralis]